MAQDPGGGRRLPRPVPRRADVPARSASRRCSPARGRRSSCGSSAPTSACCATRRRRSRRRWTTVDGRDQPQGRAAGARAAARRPAPARGRRAARPDARRRPPRGDHAGQGAEGRRGLRASRRSSTSSSGASSRCATTSRSSASLPIETPLGTQVPLGDVADVAIVPAPNEIKREGASRRLDVTCNVKGRDLGSVAREIEAKVRRPRVRPRVPPRVPRRVRRPRRNRAGGCIALAALSLLGILLIIYSDFRTLRLTALVVPDPAVRADRRRVRRGARRAACCRSARWSAS